MKRKYWKARQNALTKREKMRNSDKFSLNSKKRMRKKRKKREEKSWNQENYKEL